MGSNGSRVHRRVRPGTRARSALREPPSSSACPPRGAQRGSPNARRVLLDVYRRRRGVSRGGRRCAPRRLPCAPRRAARADEVIVVARLRSSCSPPLAASASGCLRPTGTSGSTASRADDAARHYRSQGYRLGYAPTPFFDVEWYESLYGRGDGPPLAAFEREAWRRQAEPLARSGDARRRRRSRERRARPPRGRRGSTSRTRASITPTADAIVHEWPGRRSIARGEPVVVLAHYDPAGSGRVLPRPGRRVRRRGSRGGRLLHVARRPAHCRGAARSRDRRLPRPEHGPRLGLVPRGARVRARPVRPRSRSCWRTTASTSSPTALAPSSTASTRCLSTWPGLRTAHSSRRTSSRISCASRPRPRTARSVAELLTTTCRSQQGARDPRLRARLLAASARARPPSSVPFIRSRRSSSGAANLCGDARASSGGSPRARRSRRRSICGARCSTDGFPFVKRQLLRDGIASPDDLRPYRAGADARARGGDVRVAGAVDVRRRGSGRASVGRESRRRR